ncbi:MAG: site-specific DNA-methyltransferase [Pirellulales bacterium]|nr:site-specific DNA-methyltransferase [Pirellulales bacterium]
MGRLLENVCHFLQGGSLLARRRLPPADQLIHGDCVAGLGRLAEGSVDLAFADPPFNIGYDYDVYDDRLQCDQYLDWCRTWTQSVIRALKPNGTFWLAIGDEYAAELKVMLTRELGLTCRSWVVWYYTFGVNCKQKFSRSHAHLFHFVKDARDFYFDTETIRVPSARQMVYGDRRAHAKGRLPDDTWILRPQDVPECFSPEEDTWYFPRVCGTFKERAGWHGCQMPEQLLGRIVRACSREGDLVLDPFGGSGTTLAVAKKLKRRYLGFELSPEYAARIEARLAAIAPGDPLDGAEQPTKSAPSTAAGRRLEDKHSTAPPRRRKPAAAGRQQEIKFVDKTSRRRAKA